MPLPYVSLPMTWTLCLDAETNTGVAMLLGDQRASTVDAPQGKGQLPSKEELFAGTAA